MPAADLPPDELTRLAELRSLSILDTEPEDRFDRDTRLAQRLFDVPIALVSLVDQDRQWFKSHQGLPISETPRDVSFCAHALHSDDVLHVRDARSDSRFVGNPLVEGDPNIRFYAGHPISGPGGSKLGTLCIIDREPRDLSDNDAASLRGTATDHVAEARLHARLDERNNAQASFQLRASVGQANFDPAAPVSIDVLTREADEAMYLQKAKNKATYGRD